MYRTNTHASKLDHKLAYGLLRATLGLNILMHGISRVMAGAGNFAASLEKMFHATVLPQILVRTFGYTLPWIEGTVGLLVLLGLLTRYALIAGALVILMLTFGSTLVQDWNAAGQQLTYALVFSALLGVRNWNILSLDGLFGATSDSDLTEQYGQDHSQTQREQP